MFRFFLNVLLYIKNVASSLYTLRRKIIYICKISSRSSTPPSTAANLQRKIIIPFLFLIHFVSAGGRLILVLRDCERYAVRRLSDYTWWIMYFCLSADVVMRRAKEFRLERKGSSSLKEVCMWEKSSVA